MSRLVAIPFALALAAFAVPAFADAAKTPSAVHEERAEKAEKKFPMPAAEGVQRRGARRSPSSRSRCRMERS